jgi:hypothetical protein
MSEPHRIDWLILLLFIIFGGYLYKKLPSILNYFNNNFRKGPPTHPIPVTGPIETSRGIKPSNQIDPRPLK